MTGCSAPNCNNRSESGKAFYSIPCGRTVTVRRLQWLLRMQRQKPVSRGSRICEDHFTPDQFLDASFGRNGKKRLKPGAVPSIFSQDQEVQCLPSPLETFSELSSAFTSFAQKGGKHWLPDVPSMPNQKVWACQIACPTIVTEQLGAPSVLDSESQPMHPMKMVDTVRLERERLSDPSVHAAETTTKRQWIRVNRRKEAEAIGRFRAANSEMGKEEAESKRCCRAANPEIQKKEVEMQRKQRLENPDSQKREVVRKCHCRPTDIMESADAQFKRVFVDCSFHHACQPEKRVMLDHNCCETPRNVSVQTDRMRAAHMLSKGAQVKLDKVFAPKGTQCRIYPWPTVDSDRRPVSAPPSMRCSTQMPFPKGHDKA